MSTARLRLILTKEVDRLRTSVCLCWLCFLGKLSDVAPVLCGGLC